MKRFFTFTLSLLIPALLLSQSKVTLLPNGQIKGKTNYEALRLKQSIMDREQSSIQKIAPYDVVQGVTGTVDTLRHLSSFDDSRWTTNFGMFGQDMMIQWFVAPADLDIVSVGFYCSDNTGPNVSVKLVEVNWTQEQMMSAGVTQWGYYEATGNGFNDIEPLIDNDHELIVGDWVDLEGSGAGSPFGNDIWSDGGYGAPVNVPSIETDEDAINWVSMSLLGNPSVTQGTVFGVVVKNDSKTLDGDRFGLVSSTSGTGVSGFKFYANGRFSPGDGTPDPSSWGWWSREYNWAIEVDVLLTGDRGPSITNETILPTTISTQARTVTATITDDNPSGGPAGVAAANLMYTVDGGEAIAVAMSNTGDEYTGDIPGQSPGTDVTYWIEAVDVNDNASMTAVYPYSVFEVTSNTLVYFNGYTSPSGYPQSYYFAGANFSHDVWAYGPLTEELVNYYTNIIGIATTGLRDDNQEVLAAWIAADAGHNYAVAGDEYLGSYSGWPTDDDGLKLSVTHEAGSFFYDILGIVVEYDDIVGSSADVTPIRPVQGTFLGDAMYQKVMAADSIAMDSILYDPNYEIGVVNYLDGTVNTEDSQTFMETDTTNDVSSTYADPLPATLSVGHTRELTAGNKIAFFGYDPLSVNSSPYYWFGFDESAPLVQLLDWFSIAVSVEEVKGTVAKSFNLRQNYPNPFNPTTTIEYTLPATEKVEIKVFNVVGKEVATLVNAKVAAGTHAVEFDASNLASGLYIYQIKAGKNISSKKMLLVK